MDRIQNFFQNLGVRTRRFFENPTRRNYTIGIVLLLAASLILKVPSPHVSLAAEPLVEGSWFTNSLLTTLLVDLVLIILALITRAQLAMIPRGWANVMEFAVEGLFNLTESVAGRNARKFFPWVATIFFFVIVSNYSGLIPGVGSIGIYHEESHESEATIFHQIGDQLASTQPVALPEAASPQSIGEETEAVLVPLFRAPSADLNMTVGLALVTMVLVQYWGVRALGGRYFVKFFNLRGGKGFMGVIMFIVSILELISEIAKIISFAFRLFGNIFAGEVLLAVMAFLIAFLLPVPFYGLELFVGFIQALVFMMLAVAFFSIAVVSHHDEHH